MGSNFRKLLGTDIDPKDLTNPYVIYRKMRPEYFSDSYVERPMTRDFFKFNMDRLSADGKQDLFEEFVRQVACRLIAPNLIPQTGPTGGGDGKTDIETHPVSQEILDRWYSPVGGFHGEDKWAFAISCKTDWKTKVKSDVKNIMSTGRDFTKIIFCTNQLASSRDRAALYTEFKKEYNIPVTILDLNWFEQAVFDNGCYSIAINTLNILGHEEKRVEGPLDKARNLQLQEIEERLANKGYVKNLDTEYVSDLLDYAILSRELELAPIIVRQRFYAALQEAQSHGLTQQEYLIRYQIAWTEFYWLHNPDSTLEQYAILKDFLKKEVNPVRIEKAFNLRNICYTAQMQELFSEPYNQEEDDNFWNELQIRLSNDPSLPSSYLYLQISQKEMELIRTIGRKQVPDQILSELLLLLQSADRCYEIPFDSHMDVITTLGVLIEDNPIYEKLIDTLADLQAHRNHEVSSADTHYQRGLQNMNHREYKSAIKHFGRCVSAYQKENTRWKLIRSCVILADAYKNIDLLYTAKLFLIKAQSLLYHEVANEGATSSLQVSTLFEICMIDLRLGQLSDFLHWYNVLLLFLHANPVYDNDSVLQNRMALDSALSSSLLTSDLSSKAFTRLPDVFGRFGLNLSRNVLLHQLGQNEVIADDFRDIVMSQENWQGKLADSVREIRIIYPLHIDEDSNSRLQSLICGCTLQANSHSDLTNIAYSQIFLAFLESFFIAMDFNEVALSSPNISIDVKARQGGKTEIKKGSRSYEYIAKFNTATVDADTIWLQCVSLLSHILVRNAMTNDIKTLLERKQSDELLMSRLSILANHVRELRDSSIIEYKSTISKWFDKDDQVYPNLNSTATKTASENLSAQSDRIITDLIDVPLWNQAKWKGCGYMMTYDSSEPPILMLMYQNIKAGIKIFEQWAELFNAKKLYLRIVFITGVDVEHPTWYKVLITPDLNKMVEDGDITEHRYVVAASRFHLMQTSDDGNVRFFRNLYSRFHFAGITACLIDKDNKINNDRGNCYPNVIPVRNISFREAWSIGENEAEAVTILPGDKPVIPSDHTEDAPVLAVLKRKNERYGKNK